jgi:hypothetical protein
MHFLSVDPSKGHVSAYRLVREYKIREKQGVNRVESPEVPKYGDNLCRSSKETCVRRSACSRIQRSGETGYAEVKSPKSESSKVTLHVDVTRDDLDTWDVCHMSVS